MAARRLSFWAAVAGVSIFAQFALQAAATHIKSPGFARFVDFTKGNVQ